MDSLSGPHIQPHTDLEAALHSSTSPNTSISSATELAQPSNKSVPRFRVSRMASPKPIQSTESAFFDTLQHQLEDSESHYCVFICWGYRVGDQRAVPLLIQDPEDEERIYQKLGHILYETCRWWWRYIPFYGIVDLKEIEVCKSNQHHTRSLINYNAVSVPEQV